MDEYSQTNVPSVYAIGDVTDRINLTPVALHEGMMLARTLFGGEPTKPDHKNVSGAIFSRRTRFFIFDGVWIFIYISSRNLSMTTMYNVSDDVQFRWPVQSFQTLPLVL